jgi:hypothetical protein
MKRIVAGLVLVGLVGTLFMTPTAAEAGGRYYRGHGHGGGYFVGGLAIGAVTGVILGGLLAPRVVVAEPAPVYVPPTPVYTPAPVYVPAPVCSDYWVPNQYRQGVWVQAHWERVCQ